MNEDDTYGGSKVEPAYKPSGKNTRKGTILMVAIGAPAGVVVGLLFSLLTVSGFVEVGGLLTLLFVWLLVPMLLGFALGWVVSIGAKMGKSRSGRSADRVAVICSLIAMVLYAVFRIYYLEDEAFDSLIDFLKVGVALALITGMSTFASGFMRDNPFCESCHQYLKQMNSRRLSRIEQSGLISQAMVRNFSELHHFYTGHDVTDDQYAVAECFYCDQCMKTGYINIISYHIKRKKGETHTHKRLVFSTEFTGSEVTTFAPREASTVLGYDNHATDSG